MSEITLYEGRPTTPLSPRETAAYRFLDDLQISYRAVTHEAAMTMADCEAVDRVLGVQMCKNLFLCNRQKTAFYLLLMPGDKPFHTKQLSSQLGIARLSFASGEDMERLLGLSPGSVSVLGLMNDCEGAVQLLIDRDLLSLPAFGCHPLQNTGSVCFSTKDLLEVVLPATRHAPAYVTLTDGE